MSFSCSIQHCKSFPSTKLYCGENLILLCPDHFYHHNESCSLEHRTISLLKEISNEHHQIETTLKKMIEKLSKDKEKYIEHLNKVLEIFMKENREFICTISKTTQYCKTLLKFVREKNRVPILCCLDTIKGNIIYENDIIKEVNAYNEANFNEVQDFSLNMKEALDKLRNFKSSVKIDSFDDKIYFFLDKTKILVKFDTQLLSYTKINTQVDENQGFCPSICSISSTQIFTTGGHCGTFLDCCYLINLETGTIQTLPKIRRRNTAQAFYYKGGVYIFGGYERRTLESSDMFSIESLKWKALNNLPLPMDNTSVTNFRDNELLIAGCNIDGQRFLLNYNTITDSYANFSLAFINMNHTNISVRKDHCIYLLTLNEILYSTINDLTKWQKKKNSTNIENTTSSIVVRNEKAYFMGCSGNVYEFDIGKLEFKTLFRVFN